MKRAIEAVRPPSLAGRETNGQDRQLRDFRNPRRCQRVFVECGAASHNPIFVPPDAERVRDWVSRDRRLHRRAVDVPCTAGLWTRTYTSSCLLPKLESGVSMSLCFIMLDITYAC